MADQSGTLENLAGELGLALSSLEGAFTPQNAAALFVELGLNAAPELTGDAGFTKTLEKAAQRAAALLPAVEALSKARETNNDLAAAQALRLLLAAINGLVTSLDQISADLVRATATLPEAPDLKRFALTFVERLLGDAVISYLEIAHPFLRRVLSLLSVIEVSTTIVMVDEVPTTLSRKKFHLKRLSQLLNDPFALFHDAYGWGDDGFDGKALFANVRDVFDTLIPIATTHDANEDGPADLDLFGFLVRVAAAANPPGLEGKLFADPTGQIDQTVGQFTENCRVALQIEGGLTDDLVLRLLPPAKLEARAGRNIAGRMALMILGESAERNDQFVILGESGGSRLQAAHISAGLVAEFVYDVVSDKSKADFRFEAKCTEGVLIIDPSAFDGLLASVLPSQGIRAPFAAGLVLSSGRGLTFNGSTGLDATFVVGLSVGPVTVSMVHVSLHPSDTGVTVEVSASVSVSIGPVHTLIDRVGIATAVTFPKKGGNLGVADLELGFKPPSGVGLKIDSPVVTGGGFLLYDAERAQYGGVVQLEFTQSGLSLKAVGLISTRLPGGAKGFSMIVIITAEGFKPVPLGLGFTLTAIGGLVAINRTFNEEAVRAGIKSHALERVLFPQDPIGHASQLISSLNNFFPAQKDSYLLGVLVQIEWGLSSPLKMQLALILELGRRTRFIVLGHITLTLPSEDHDLVRLNMDTLGVLDFDQHTAAVDAALYDSRLLKKFVLTGQMAMRLRWGSSPQFALSVGGFHPAFKPPAGFPALERLALSLSDSDHFRLRCEGYFALTSNTLQFGARAELMARAGGCSIQGEIGFDALIQFDPFMFVAGFHASVQFKMFSRSVATVSVKGELSGPRPLHIKGKASFSIFWCTFSVRFSKTLVSGEPPPRPEPVKVMARLTAALADARNWGGQLPDGDLRLVTLRERQLPKDVALQEVALHPLGKLSVKQSVVPLELEIAKFGPATPADAHFFKINSVSVNGKSIDLKRVSEFERVTDFFAPAEFLEMTDDEKLAAPSFEPLTAGFRLNADSFILPELDSDLIEEPAISYETIIISDKKQPALKSDTLTALDAAQLARQLRFGAAGRSDVRRTGATKFSTAGVKNVLTKTGWVVVSAAHRTRQSAPGIEAGKLVSYAEAFQALQQLKRENPALAKGLKIARASEPVN